MSGFVEIWSVVCSKEGAAVESSSPSLSSSSSSVSVVDSRILLDSNVRSEVDLLQLSVENADREATAEANDSDDDDADDAEDDGAMEPDTEDPDEEHEEDTSIGWSPDQDVVSDVALISVSASSK